MASQKIEFEKLLNTRDLGGMTGKNGRSIKPGKLFRSGHLYSASEDDLHKLSGLIGHSVDFRSDQECQEKPEPSLPGVKYTRLPVLSEKSAGVERDEQSFAEVRRKMLVDSNAAVNYMRQTYKNFITNEHSIRQYERFIRILMEDHEKGVLWHCTAGKDRAGFGTVIVEELLGVSREDIEADYLYTNECLEPEIFMLTKMISQQEGADPAIAAESAAALFSAKIEYLNSAYDEIGSRYGSFDNYITKALRITPEERTQFQELYLS